jgi:Histidine kinase-like ATPase domain/GAF domain
VSSAVDGRPRAETDSWVRSAFRVLSGIDDVTRVGLALAEGGGRRLLFAASDRENVRGVDWCEVDAFEDVPLNKAIRTGRSVIGSLDDLAGRYPEFVGRQSASTRALASVPLTAAAGEVLGGFALFYDSAQPFDGDQREALEGLGRRLGEALRRARPVWAPARSHAGGPLPAGAYDAAFLVGPDLADIPAARHFVRGTLSEWHVRSTVADDVVLCLNELVTNALIHTVAGCEVRLGLRSGTLRASVHDGGTEATGLHSFAEDPMAVRGRGLRIVDLLALSWGTVGDAVGTTVWCEFRIDPAGEGRSAG